MEILSKIIGLDKKTIKNDIETLIFIMFINYFGYNFTFYE